METARQATTVGPDRARVSEIQRLVASALAEAEGRGASRRSFLSGLWQASIGVLLALGEPADVVDLLVDRVQGVRGQGRNADAPLIVLEGEALERRSRESTIAAEAVLDAVRHRLDSGDDADASFPEELLDASLALLVDAWGPAHVRRALSAQVSAIEGGSLAPVMPMEPSASNKAPRVDRPPPFQPASVPVQAAAVAHAAPPADAYPSAALQSGRRVDLHVDSECLPGGMGVFASAMVIDDVTGRRETREVGAVIQDGNGRAGPLAAVTDALLALGPPAPGETVRITTPVEYLVRGMATSSVRGADVRLPAEASQWAIIDRCVRDRAVEWILRRPGVGNDLAQRCDRLIRLRAEELDRAA